MKFEPYYSPNHRNDLNLQDLSQRVQLQRDDFEYLRSGDFEKRIKELLPINAFPDLLKSKDEITIEMEKLSQNPEYTALFGEYSLKESEAATIVEFQKLLEVEALKGADEFWVVEPAPDLGANNPAWPIQYLFFDGSLKFENNKLVVSDSSGQFYISTKSCFNYLTPIKITRANPYFDYFFLLKLLLISGHYIRTVKEYLHYHLIANFQSNTTEYAEFLVDAMADNAEVELPDHIKDFVRDWIKLKQTASSLPNKSVGRIGRRKTKLHFDDKVISVLKEFCQDTTNQSSRKFIAAKTLREVCKMKGDKITGAAIARLFIDKGIVKAKKSTLEDQFKKADLDRREQNSDLFSKLSSLI